MPTPRFKIRKLSLVDTEPTRPWAMKDRERRFYIGQFKTFDAAIIAADNIVRRERGFGPRLTITTAEILEHMEPTA